MKDSRPINPDSTEQLLFGHSGHAESIAGSTLASVLTAYLEFYASGSGHTARAKRLDGGKFIQFLRRYRRLADSTALKVKDWDFSATQHFVDECLKVGEAPATVSRRLATIKHMGRVLSERIPGFINPARDVKPPRLQVLKPKSITSLEVGQIKERAASRRHEKRSFNRVRNETLLNVLLDTGLRADEVRTLRLGQLDQHLEWIEKVKTKGRRFRTVYVTAQMRPALREYLTLRAQELKRFFPSISASQDARLPLFISGYNAQVREPSTFEMSPKSVWRAIRECSVDTKLHPHLLRHTYAVELLEESRDVRLVAQALGHSDVRVTMRYTERANEEVAKALEQLRSTQRHKKE
jgi:site-specific recombinase XerD